MQKTWVQSLHQEDPLEKKKKMAIHSSILVWEIPWTEEPGGLESMELQTVRHNWVTNTNNVSSAVYGGFFFFFRSFCTDSLIWFPSSHQLGEEGSTILLFRVCRSLWRSSCKWMVMRPVSGRAAWRTQLLWFQIECHSPHHIPGHFLVPALEFLKDDMA